MHKLITLAAAMAMTLAAQAQQLAFPGAEGFGAYATGGRGGTVVHVTNLNASGPGSLADAVSQPGRIVVFDVGGVIDVTNVNLTISSNITIAGQTAPGEGITIYGGRVIMSNASNVIIRYIRMRGSISMPSDKCTLTMDYCQNVILDHCTISWGRWDNVHIKDAKDITWQNCIISEGIEPQRFGAITDGTTNWTISHCLWANNKSRNPKMKCQLQYYNNVVYNYSMGIIGGHSAANHYQDVMNNYFIAGPSTGTNKYFDDWTETDHLYSTGNYTDGDRDGQLNGTLITDYNGATPMQQPNLTCNGPMNLETAEEAYYTVVEHVGASRVRDAHDLRIIEQLTSLGTQGAFIADESEVGGIGNLSGGTAPVDTDGDGMSDEWEMANGTDPNTPDANGDVDGNGYTNIEDYINSLAHRSDYLMYPQGLTAALTSPTTVVLTWSNPEDDVDKIVVEQSVDGITFEVAKEVESGVSTVTIEGLTEGQVYYFRLKNVKGEEQSLYSAVVSVNDLHMRPAGGIPAGTTTFTPEEGKLYRIINYGTVAFNSSTTYAGNPKYLKFLSNGALGSTGDFEWNNPELLWEITPDPANADRVLIRNYATKKYMTRTDSLIDGEERVGASGIATGLTIVYASDEQVQQSGVTGGVAMFRINNPDNRGFQLRPKSFNDNWIWNNGTVNRADMVYTFVAIDASLIGLYTNVLTQAIASAEQTADQAMVGQITLGYPQEAYDKLMEAIGQAKDALQAADSQQLTQDEVNDAAARLDGALSDFRATQIMTLQGYDPTKQFTIYSYGTMSNANATDATSATQRRYLSVVKQSDGVGDSLVFLVGLSDDEINAGNADNVAAMRASRWNITPAADGNVYVRNEQYGSYMQISHTLSATPATIYPYYAREDNGKQAFYMQVSADNTLCLNVGTPNADGLGGNMSFAMPANRTRLRWIVEQLDVTTDIQHAAVSDAMPTVAFVNGRFVCNASGAQLTVYAADGRQVGNSGLAPGLYIIRCAVDGHTTVSKMAVR